MRIVLPLIICACAVVTNTHADDFESLRQSNWPHWRGPNADGVAPHANPPTTWDESTNIKWKVEIPGSGSSTPIVWKDRIYLTSAVKTEKKGKPVDASAGPQFGRRPRSGPATRR